MLVSLGDSGPKGGEAADPEMEVEAVSEILRQAFDELPEADRRWYESRAERDVKRYEREKKRKRKEVKTDQVVGGGGDENDGGGNQRLPAPPWPPPRSLQSPRGPSLRLAAEGATDPGQGGRP